MLVFYQQIQLNRPYIAHFIIGIVKFYYGIDTYNQIVHSLNSILTALIIVGPTQRGWFGVQVDKTMVY